THNDKAPQSWCFIFADHRKLRALLPIPLNPPFCKGGLLSLTLRMVGATVAVAVAVEQALGK
ncbi:MAG: hypothetical protein ACI35M_04480, partial [Alistipes sp.]